jgi:hypothetical protein
MGDYNPITKMVRGRLTMEMTLWCDTLWHMDKQIRSRTFPDFTCNNRSIDEQRMKKHPIP